MTQLVLDPAIKTWVLFPVMLVVLCVGLLRHYVSQLLKSKPAAPSRKKMHRSQMLQRCKRLRAHGHLLSPAAVRRRQQWLSQKGLESVRWQTDPNGMPQDMDQMSSAMGQMKGSMMMIVPNILSMTFINYMFSGFVLLRLPFPLTEAFKPMLQRGISLRSLDPSYVSSLSWYFLNMFGLRGVFALLLGKNNQTDDAKLLQQQMQMGGMGMGQSSPFAQMGQQQDPNKPLTYALADVIDLSDRVAKRMQQHA
ncbi:MAG: hypothetical protein MHM6MM_005500 [Cercozoa sp. M6MM]